MAEQKPETVLELTKRIKYLLESTITNVWVEGEVSNLTLHASGHAYFSLKDAGAQISCTLFGYSRSIYAKTIPLKNGLKLRARGSVSVYEPRGSYQLNVRSIDARVYRLGFGSGYSAPFERGYHHLTIAGRAWLYDSGYPHTEPLSFVVLAGEDDGYHLVERVG